MPDPRFINTGNYNLVIQYILLAQYKEKVAQRCIILNSQDPSMIIILLRLYLSKIAR